jgi:HSP20 family molecular chaperone IbpA
LVPTPFASRRATTGRGGGGSGGGGGGRAFRRRESVDERAADESGGALGGQPSHVRWRLQAAQGETIQVLTLTHVTVQTETSTEVKVEVPGIDPSTIGVGFENSLLHVHCDRGELTLPIDPTVDVSKIKADIQIQII